MLVRAFDAVPKGVFQTQLAHQKLLMMDAEFGWDRFLKLVIEGLQLLVDAKRARNPASHVLITNDKILKLRSLCIHCVEASRARELQLPGQKLFIIS